MLWAQGDLTGAGKTFSEALAIFRALAAADPTNAGLQRDIWKALSQLASIGSPDVHWSDVVAQGESMDAKGMLAPPDRAFLDTARANAAREAGK